MYTIKNLAGFVSIIEGMDDFYFRGESKDYAELKNMASGYRWMITNDKSYQDLLKLRSSFYQEIGYLLSDKDIENFISYSQHHTLPTELLDVSENPLVALFFACESNPKRNGFVYSLNKNKTVSLESSLIKDDITQQLFPFSDQIISPLFGDYCEPDHVKIIDKLCSEDEMLNYIKEFTPREDNYFFERIKEHHGWMDMSSSSDPMAIDLISDNINSANEINELMKSYVFEDKGQVNELMNSTQKWGWVLPPYFTNDYPSETLFRLYLMQVAFDLHECNDIKFPPIKYLVHQPSVIFDRMINQQGSFIYQNHVLKDDGKISVQKNSFDQIFKIPASKKQDILRQLDNIGINRKFIYPDHDNIAQYIKNTFK